MSKRIFTKVLASTVNVQAGIGAEVEQNSILQWLVQEDIEVIAISLAICCSAPSENDGFTKLEVEISQVAVAKQDGLILAGVATEGWNTTPAGICATNCNESIVFPLGLAVPVKEEGYLHLNAVGVGKSAGTCGYQVVATIFYTKKGSR